MSALNAVRPARRRALAMLLLAPIALGACTAPADEEDPVEDAGTSAPEPADGVDEDEGDTSGLDGLVGEISLSLGDCWGLEDEIELDPIPCDGPHVFEVVGIIEDWPYEQYEGGFEEGAAGEDAMMDACDVEAAAYFGYDPLDEGIMVDHDTPAFWGREDVVFCSAHSGPDVEYVRDEVVGSFADRGWR